jgi:hypothetical protein
MVLLERYFVTICHSVLTDHYVSLVNSLPYPGEACDEFSLRWSLGAAVLTLRWSILRVDLDPYLKEKGWTA